MKQIGVVILCLMSLVSFGQNSETPYKFFESLINNQMTTEEIAAKFLTVLSADKETSSMIQTHLNLIRDDLKKKSAKMDSVKVVSYGDVPESERKIMLGDLHIENIYLVYFSKSDFVPILIENDKVAAFATLNKGKISVFWRY